jgi:hypothetical protein
VTTEQRAPHAFVPDTTANALRQLPLAKNSRQPPAAVAEAFWLASVSGKTKMAVRVLPKVRRLTTAINKSRFAGRFAIAPLTKVRKRGPPWNIDRRYGKMAATEDWERLIRAAPQ